MDITPTLILVIGLVIGYFIRRDAINALSDENKHLRECLYLSRGYKPPKAVQTQAEPIPQNDEPTVDMRPPVQWDTSTRKPPDLFEARALAAKKDTLAVNQARKEMEK